MWIETLNFGQSFIHKRSLYLSKTSKLGSSIIILREKVVNPSKTPTLYIELPEESLIKLPCFYVMHCIYVTCEKVNFVCTNIRA